MKLDIDGYYIAQVGDKDIIVQVKKKKSDKYFNVWWKCITYSIIDKSEKNWVNIRRRAFKIRLGGSIYEAMRDFPEYFI